MVYRYHFELIDTFKADDKLILFVLTENFMYILLDIALEMLCVRRWGDGGGSGALRLPRRDRWQCACK